MTLGRLFWLSVLVSLVGVFLIVFWSAPMVGDAAGPPLDTRTDGYGFEEVRAYLAALGPEATAAYLGPQRIADTIFPIGFLGVLSLGTFLALRSFSSRVAFALSLVSVGYFALDMLENAAVARLLRAGPDGITEAMVALTSVLTVWKFHFVNTALVILVLGWVVRAGRWIATHRRG